jgi:segregation and condensation protein A
LLDIKVEKFEGPLSLLLELIEKEKLDITEISLSKVTNQYLARISTLDPKVYDVAEFMVIAARLIYLKSKALLPSLETEEEEQEIEDLKAKLEVYKKYKEAAGEFSNILNKNQRSFSAKKPKITFSGFTPPKGVELPELWRVFQHLLADMPEELTRQEIELPGEKITVEERLAHLEGLFAKKRTHRFSQLLGSSHSKLEAIVTFLAILEMVKLKQIGFTQLQNFEDIELTRK